MIKDLDLQKEFDSRFTDADLVPVRFNLLDYPDSMDELKSFVADYFSARLVNFIDFEFNNPDVNTVGSTCYHVDYCGNYAFKFNFGVITKAGNYRPVSLYVVLESDYIRVFTNKDYAVCRSLVLDVVFDLCAYLRKRFSSVHFNTFNFFPSSDVLNFINYFMSYGKFKESPEYDVLCCYFD
ncbi:hypothetical protein [Sigmofec virus UA08Rod_5092]|uniref:Uncharacterized protein n=1 Tax=Sigmofec virus UA08Rod_5092 TaxID=2929415 RepID=A0A976N0Z1_9VIRU|nr:hypothetical protein [Sigmofec virus UA08Rod_5092]